MWKICVVVRFYTTVSVISAGLGFLKSSLIVLDEVDI